MPDKPEAVAWFMDEPIADDDPLAAVKHRARAHAAAAEVLAGVIRSAEVTERAGTVDQVADLLMTESCDPEAVWDAAEAAGTPEDMIDAAGNVALILARIEHDGIA